MENEVLDLMDLKLDLQDKETKYNNSIIRKIKRFFLKKEKNLPIQKLEKNEINYEVEYNNKSTKKTYGDIVEEIQNYNKIVEKNKLEDINIKLLKQKKVNIFKRFYLWLYSYIFSSYKSSPKKFKIRNRILLFSFISVMILMFVETDNGYKEKELKELALIEKKYELLNEEKNRQIRKEVEYKVPTIYVEKEKEIVVPKREVKRDVKQLFKDTKLNKSKEVENPNEFYFSIQIYVVKHIDKIERDLQKLKKLNYNYRLEEIVVKNEKMYRVLVGKYTTKREANKDLRHINKELKSQGFIRNYK